VFRVSVNVRTVTTSIRRHYANIDGRQIHYRRGGTGPPLVLLHPGPRSSRIFEPLINVLADRFTVFALDREGFGNSDALTSTRPEIPDFAEALKADLEALGLERVVLYGSAIGSAIATEFARRHPERVEYLLLDNVVLLSDAEAAYMLANYPPRFEPRWDGGHLTFLWTVVHDIHVFQPWCRRRADKRRRSGMPPLRAIHETFVDLLHAGDEGHLAYEALYRWPPGPAMEQLTVKTAVHSMTIMEGQTIALPPCVEIVNYLGGTGPQTLEQIAASTAGPGSRPADPWLGDPKQLKELAERAEPAGHAPPERDAPPLPGRIARSYVEAADGRQVHFRIAGREEPCPLFLFHDTPRTSAQLEPLIAALGDRRRIYALDTPGAGYSDECDRPGPTIEDFAAVLLAAIDRLHPAELDLYGIGTGSLIAAEVALHAPDRVHHVVLDGVPLVAASSRDELLEHLVPSIEPTWDGTHLTEAWYSLRAGELYAPWYAPLVENVRPVEPLDPVALHGKFFELVTSSAGHAHALGATLSYPIADRLGSLPHSTLVCARVGDPSHPVLDEVAELIPHARVNAYSAWPGELAALLTEFTQLASV
jgi:pimeloyl-ACP methyl ester carboxylesterase